MTVEVPQIQLDDGMVGMLGLVLGTTVDTWSASAPGCFWMGSPYSLRGGLLGSRSRCRIVDASVASTAGHTWKLDTTSRASRLWQFLVRCLGVLFMGRLCAGAALCQPTAVFARISSSTSICSRCSHLENWTLLFFPRIFQHWFGVLGVACGVQRFGFFSGRVRYLVQQWIHVLREAFWRILHLFYGELESGGVLPPFTQNGERAQ